MSARDEAVAMIRRICPPHLSADEYGRILAEKFDAYRAEVVREAMRLIDAHPHPGDNPVSFYCGLLESLLPDVEEKATAEAATATPDFFQPAPTSASPANTSPPTPKGAAKHGAGSTAPTAPTAATSCGTTTTPSGRRSTGVTAVTDQITVRRRRLLAEIRRTGGRYTTGQAHRFYRATGYGPCRTTARKDLQWWARRGVLIETGTVNNRSYWIAGDAR